MRFALRQLVSQRLATAFAAAGLLTSTVGFILLASTSQTAAAALRGDAEKQWPSPFDLLVRPASAVTGLEKSQGLVRPNYLSGLVGGITIDQLLRIRRIPGVQVAAPIAVVGFVNWPAGRALDLSRQVAGHAISVFRISQNAIGDAGLSHFPTSTRYLVVASDGRLQTALGGVTQLHIGAVTVECTGAVDCVGGGTAGGSPANATTFVSFNEPVLLAGVDPVAEAALSGAAGCVRTGRYLRAGDSPQLAATAVPVVPVLASATSFIDETVSVHVDAASQPQTVLTGAAPSSLRTWSPVSTQSNTADQLFAGFLSQGLGSYYNTGPITVPGPVSYGTVAGAHLAAHSVPPDLSVFTGAFGRDPSVPPEARDTWLRHISLHQFINSGGANAQGQSTLQPPNRWQVVGRFDPQCFTGSSTSGALAGFAPATVTMGDGVRLGATRSVAGYVNPPPALLTTLAGAAYFADPARFAGGPGAALISAIRIRVAGVQQPGPLSEARLARVAAAVHAATGLAVDIVKGSAQRSISIDLPAGRFGRPPSTVTEGWSVKGVVVDFVNTVGRANLALFAVVLVGAAILVGQTTYGSTRRRRREFGVLRALGWSPARIAVLVELETVTLAGTVGVAALLVDLVVSIVLHTGSLGWQLALSPVVAIGLAGLATAMPALMISRSSVAATLRPPRRSRRRSRPPSLAGFACREMTGAWRAEALLGAGAVGLGGALLGGAVLIATSFGGAVDASLLGNVVSGQLRGFHVVLGGLVLVIGTVAAGQIVTLSYLERQPDLAVLRALGWHRRSVAAVAAIQAVVLGLAGGLAAAACVALAAWLLGAGAPAAVVACGAAVAVSLVAGACASAGPLLLAWRASPSAFLRN
ncbi:MAG: FtsX-like permease family protein [Candidatus Dormibacteria bacterium]